MWRVTEVVAGLEGSGHAAGSEKDDAVAGVAMEVKFSLSRTRVEVKMYKQNRPRPQRTPSKITKDTWYLKLNTKVLVTGWVLESEH